MEKLSSLREQIDNIDEQIVKLLCERFDAVQNIAEYKKAHGLEILQKARESEVLNKIAGKINNREYQEYILKIYAEILETSKSLQRNL